MEKDQSIEVTELPESGYVPLVDYAHWRVAVLRYCPDVQLENLHSMQKHMETDEVFVLLSGHCTLYAAGDGGKPGEISALPLLPCRIYNVKKGHWHTHALDPEGAVLIVENRDTCDANSPVYELTEPERKILTGISI